MKRSKRLTWAALLLILPAAVSTAEIQKAEMAGYLLVSTDKVPDTYNAGFSLYAAAWPLLERYPGHRFQTGLFGTWMHAQYEGKPPTNLYSDIEGGLGWWRDTRFPTETPKFIMGGVAPNFCAWANGPGAGKGRDWNRPAGKYGIAQLSPWVLWPPDGLNLKQGTCGELFGYGYLPLPLTSPKATTGGKPVPTGDQCWTLFLNTKNFKGPVCFFTPYFWSHSAEENTNYAGLLLDARPSAPNKPFQMETQYVPAAIATDEKGETFARVAPTSFPVGPDGNTVVLHRLTSYTRKALWDGVKAWFEGGPAVSGAINPDGAHAQTLRANGGSTWRIYAERTPKEQKVAMAWSSFATPVTPDPMTYGYTWHEQLVRKVDAPSGSRVVLPEYYRLLNDGKKSQWVVATPAEVPARSGLTEMRFERPNEKPPEPYDTPAAPESPFKKPGPVAGPFKAHLGDGSVVTYYWYRFADQPAMLNADLTKEERERMQAKVEKLHRAWTKDRNYLAPPTVGTLADLDPAQLVNPPKGYEIGYVPIATRQEPDALETAAGWKKFEGNPVMGGKYGTCFDISVLREGVTYRMWLSWRPKKSVALVESKDGIHWSEPPQVVFGPRTETGWEDDINRPYVLKRVDGYHMWYTGQAKGRSWIGYARSPDGVEWKRMSDRPVLTADQPWEKNIAVMCPSVLWDEQAKLFRMWYSGGEQNEPNAIGLATSPDGLTWKKHAGNPIFTADPKSPWEKHKVTACQVEKAGDGYVMFYIGFENEGTARICLARSKDGLTNWQRHPANPIIFPGKDKWDHDACYKPYAIFDGTKWLLWYNGRRGHLEQVGVALHEGEALGFDP